MKQLLLITMVSVVCSVVAVNWLSPCAGVSAGGGHNNQQGVGQRQTGQQTGGNHQGGQRQGAQRQDVEGTQRGNGRQGNRDGAQAEGARRQGGYGGQQAGGQRGRNRAGDSGEMLASERGQRQGNRGGQGNGAHQSGGHSHGRASDGNGGQGGRNNRIAGFSSGDIEISLAEMTEKLALSPDQQAIIREALENYQRSAKTAREQFMHTRSQLTSLDITVATYERDKARVLKSAQTAYQQLLLLTVSTREAIYQSLNTTQQQILTNLEA